MRAGRGVLLAAGALLVLVEALGSYLHGRGLTPEADSARLIRVVPALLAIRWTLRPSRTGRLSLVGWAAVILVANTLEWLRVAPHAPLTTAGLRAAVAAAWAVALGLALSRPVSDLVSGTPPAT